ncbi:hypothetical protein DL766_007853 [Monosporascus sp. MC13-8B]|uniref:F-box domain-containing protein n=1 Tax=Monosporascus cannonballus TaxID=155416 RepID=A0ABY0HCL2_9PEZI|nr:hypothetical protein DL762_004280 [Monosporascus cannonballus]RYP21870.1 hypothetical protein DL766_007853 [Monosporascus sp. MC13-8B]
MVATYQSLPTELRAHIISYLVEPFPRHPSFIWKLVTHFHDGSPAPRGVLRALGRQSRAFVLRRHHLHLNDDEEQLYLHTYVYHGQQAELCRVFKWILSFG